MRMLVSVLLLGVLMTANAAAAADTHPFSILDMLAMDRIGDPQVSPDGETIVFTRRATDLDKNKGLTDLWLVNVDGSGLRRLTSNPATDVNPRFSPNGKYVWFLSSRSDSMQVWRIPVDGGEAEQMTEEPLDVGNLVVSPTGKHIAYTMDVYVGKTPAETKAELDKIAERKSTGRTFDGLFFRHWDTWKDGRRSHLFVRGTGGGESIDVMEDMDADTPSKPFGGPEEITFTPDGESVVFSARNVGREEAWSTDFDLYVASIVGGGAPRCITEANNAWDTQPVFSPDGKTLAYLAMKRPGYESDRQGIMLRPWPNGEPRELAPHWDRSAGSIVWSPDGTTIFTTADNVGQRSLYRIDVATGDVSEVVSVGTVRSPAAAGDRIVFGMDNLRSPVELYVTDADGNHVERITHINDEKVAAARMGEPEQFSFKGWNDETVYCYVVKPIDFDPSKKYPVAFLIHGGPQGSFGNDFHYRWNPQAYAGAGYAAVMVDFHGSTGYGQAFCDSIRGDWGGKPFEDLQKGLAAALERYPWMDGERVGALGASFGGYMINWVAGNWPDRFKCLICHDGNIDERMAYFDTEELWFPEWDHEGTPWSNPSGYDKHNPVNYVQNWKTPMLIVHGGQDFRVVETQGFSAFTACQRMGIPSKLLYFPDECHWVLKPANSIQWHEMVIDWLDRWCKRDGKEDSQSTNG